MDRAAKLLIAGNELRRRIWTSLPWGLRLANVFVRLSASHWEAFGIGMFQVFQKAGVEGMPEDRGAFHRAAVEFGQKAYKMLLAKSRNPTVTAEVLSSFFLRFFEAGKEHLKPGSSLKDAENYVFVGLNRQLINYFRERSQRGHESLTREDDEGESTVDLEDPHVFQEFEKKFPAWKMPALKRELERIHKDAPLYVQLLAEGYDSNEIVGDARKGIPSMLPHPVTPTGQPLNPQNWDFTKKKIMETLTRFYEKEQHAHPG